ncbi:hypothetical protein [Streptomyces sp. V3I7]|uniref:hypothetical protein n=1 Tax=Streptomyces sp. V3I7 TaxID=3042278 RepID=UPI00278688B0|nr:hypothetical protein [Streptomyces sp. V3I7]MDQ0991152.1 hypothetical protein [Streptomyces sp. V3I7]
MRRTRLQRPTPPRHATVVAATAALLLMGCGTSAGDTGAGGSAASPSGSSAPPATTCVTHAELTAADHGRVVCLVRGGQIRLTLDGTEERPWAPVTERGDALRAANPGFVILPGDAVAAYDAVAPGLATLSSTRPLCASLGKVSCKGIQHWTVTVLVR